MEIINKFSMNILSRSANEGFARATVAAFAAQLDPTLEEINDIKTAVSEAVTNCIVHAYREEVGEIIIEVKLCEGRLICIDIRDKGCGIENIKQAREPLFTTDAAGERSGMGFTVMESFCDELRVTSRKDRGTTVTLLKRLHK